MKRFAGLSCYLDRLGPGTWDPLLQCLHLDKPLHLLMQQNMKKLYGTKSNCVLVQLGQIMDNKVQKDQKTQLPLLKSGSKSRVLHMPLAHNTTKAVGKPPKPPLWPYPRTCPYPHPIWGTSSPPSLGASSPAAAAGVPIKPCLNFLSGLWSISIA